MQITVPDAVSILIPVIVGAVAVPLITWLKTILGWTGDDDATKQKNIWLTFVVALIMAVVLLVITNAFVAVTITPLVIIQWFGLTFLTATMVYRNIASQVPTAPVPPAQMNLPPTSLH